MKKITVGLLLLFTSTIGLAQETTKKQKKVRPGKQIKISSTQQINQLQNGALLVRLKTQKSTIAALRKKGKDELADKRETQQADLNREIITAFQTYFDFCPTYFFFSDCSNTVREKQFDSVDFLNHLLQIDTTIVFNKKPFLTAEFGTIEQDTTKYFDGYYYFQGENGLERRTRYYGGTNMGFGALVIKSDQFIQLKKPFPYYVRTFDSLPIKRSPKTVVKKMNKKLHRFYN
jgi:hypothetical protein